MRKTETLSPAGLNVIETAFALTPEEVERVKDCPFRAAANEWAYFGDLVLEEVLSAYASGEIDLREMLETVRACSLGGHLQDRVNLLALAVERSRRITPKPLNRRRPPVPTWLKRLAVAVLDQVRADRHPELAFAPSEAGGRSSPVLDEAIRWLAALQLVSPNRAITGRSLYDWHLRSRREAGWAVRRGRPKKIRRKST